MEDTKKRKKKIFFRDFPGGPVVKSLPSSAGDMDSILVGELKSHKPYSAELLSYMHAFILI